MPTTLVWTAIDHRVGVNTSTRTLVVTQNVYSIQCSVHYAADANPILAPDHDWKGDFNSRSIFLSSSDVPVGIIFLDFNGISAHVDSSSKTKLVRPIDDFVL